MATAFSSWMHVSICGWRLPRSFTRLSCRPRKLAPGTSATSGSWSRCSMRAIASLPQTSRRDVEGTGVSGTMGGTDSLGVIDRLPEAEQAYRYGKASGKAARSRATLPSSRVWPGSDARDGGRVVEDSVEEAARKALRDEGAPAGARRTRLQPRDELSAARN